MRFLVGLIGSGIAASGSPAIHEHEAQSLGIQLHYHLIDLRESPGRLPDALDAVELIGFAGVNVTYPCKQTVIEYLDELTPDAEAIGAVNTVVFRNGKRTGHNTDWQGFRESFQRGLPSASLESLLVVGAGGGGSAVSYAALRMGARQVRVFDEMPERAQSLAAKLGPPVFATTNLDQALREAAGIIHATPTG